MNNLRNNYTKFNLFNYNKSKIFLIKWAENCITNFHYHPDIKCSYFLLYGNLSEIICKINPESLKSNEDTIKYKNINNFLQKGYIDDDIGGHIIKNNLNKNSYSLHIYTKK